MSICTKREDKRKVPLLPVTVHLFSAGFDVRFLGKRAYLRPVLEHLPKWEALKDLLSEIQQEIRNASHRDNEKEKSILIVCREMFLKSQLQWAIQGIV